MFDRISAGVAPLLGEKCLSRHGLRSTKHYGLEFWMEPLLRIAADRLFHAFGRGIVLLFRRSRLTNRLCQRRAEVDSKGIRNAQQRVNRRKPFALFHAHHHRVAQAGARGDFVKGQFLPEPFCLNQFNQPGYDRFTFGGFRHTRFLREQLLDDGYDYRHSPCRIP